jgi:hypothetical protein
VKFADKYQKQRKRLNEALIEEAPVIFQELEAGRQEQGNAVQDWKATARWVLYPRSKS